VVLQLAGEPLVVCAQAMNCIARFPCGWFEPWTRDLGIIYIHPEAFNAWIGAGCGCVERRRLPSTSSAGFVPWTQPNAMSACHCHLLPLLVLLPTVHGHALRPFSKLMSLLCGSSCAEFEHTALPANLAAELGSQDSIRQQQPPWRSEPAEHLMRGSETELPSCCFAVEVAAAAVVHMWLQQQLCTGGSCCNRGASFTV
jgi:hypothetical protein